MKGWLFIVGKMKECISCSIIRDEISVVLDIAWFLFIMVCFM